MSDKFFTFEDALKSVDRLMGILYNLRYQYDPRSEVWIHIPTAQNHLNAVRRAIEEAAKSSKP